jgi:hypothetical protein
MEILTSKSTRRSTRLRVQIPVTLTSLDRRQVFVAECTALIVSPQGCGLRTTQALPLETPVMLSGLPGDASVSARVANCLPIGLDGKYFLVGVSLYNPGNVWGIADPPEDWNCAAAAAAAGAPSKTVPTKGPVQRKDVWPYNVFSGHTEAHPGRK